MSDDDDPMVAHNVEMPESLKDRVQRYARDQTISQAAATRILLDQALTRAGYPKGR